MLPRVSIIVPVYNGQAYLRESLDSIMAQTYANAEILVMDDASTDNTQALVSLYGDRLTYYRQPQNRGQFANVNDGIAKVDGDYVAVFHADDVYMPTIVEQEVAFLQSYPDAGAVFCLDVFIDALGRKYGSLEVPPEVRGGRPIEYPVILNALLKYKNRFLVGPSAMVRASVYQDVGFYRGEEYGIASDLEMWARIARKYSIGILDEHLMCYRHGHGNSTQTYYHLRTEPEGHFRILDSCLQNGGRAVATAQALTAHEAHRAEDRLMRAINYYIQGDLSRSAAVLGEVRSADILASEQVQSARLLILWVLMRLLLLLPRIRLVANFFYRRWHVKNSLRRDVPHVATRGSKSLSPC